MRATLFLLFCLAITACSQTRYLVQQGQGQLALHWNAKRLSDVLNDSSVASENKKKILLIQRLRHFFSQQLQTPLSQNYQTVSFLENKAVTYLVIASPAHTIQPLKHHFWPFGEFPYLGFFEKKDAEVFAKELEAQRFQTHTRPVYAYSSLGYFRDPILSSFFEYSYPSLVEVILEELFHEQFFLRYDVDFSENIATFFAQELAVKFIERGGLGLFQQDWYSKKSFLEYKKNSWRYSRALRKQVVKGAQVLRKAYDLNPGCSADNAGKCKQILDRFLNDEFRPNLRKLCDTYNKGSSCAILKLDWNNAVFAAQLTYKKQRSDIKNFFTKKQISLKRFLKALNETKDSFSNKSENQFWSYFKQHFKG